MSQYGRCWANISILRSLVYRVVLYRQDPYEATAGVVRDEKDSCESAAASKGGPVSTFLFKSEFD